jgi:hypothetical protein
MKRFMLCVLACLLSHVASAQATPDLSGGWLQILDGPPPLLRLYFAPPAVKPELLPQLRAAMENLRQQGGVDYCRPFRVVGFQNGRGFGDALEFLFTPGRITLLNEYGMIRYIHLDRLPVPEAELPESTDSGTSVGHWENGTLVIETTRLNPAAKFPLPIPGAPVIGHNARLVERIHLQGTDTLVIESSMTAPELFTAPFEITTRYRRDRKHVPLEYHECAEEDRLTEPGSGQLRFDLTPPPDLPLPDAARSGPRGR